MRRVRAFPFEEFRPHKTEDGRYARLVQSDSNGNVDVRGVANFYSNQGSTPARKIVAAILGHEPSTREVWCGSFYGIEYITTEQYQRLQRAAAAFRQVNKDDHDGYYAYEAACFAAVGL
jgi:hypothetical protein